MSKHDPEVNADPNPADPADRVITITGARFPPYTEVDIQIGASSFGRAAMSDAEGALCSFHSSDEPARLTLDAVVEEMLVVVRRAEDRRILASTVLTFAGSPV